jgi:hypothetical protein
VRPYPERSGGSAGACAPNRLRTRCGRCAARADVTGRAADTRRWPTASESSRNFTSTHIEVTAIRQVVDLVMRAKSREVRILETVRRWLPRSVRRLRYRRSLDVGEDGGQPTRREVHPGHHGGLQNSGPPNTSVPETTSSDGPSTPDQSRRQVIVRPHVLGAEFKEISRRQLHRQPLEDVQHRQSAGAAVELISPPMLDPPLVGEPGGQRCLEYDRPFLSLSWPWRRPTRAGQMRVTRPACAAEMRGTSRAPGPGLARHRS